MLTWCVSRFLNVLSVSSVELSSLSFSQSIHSHIFRLGGEWAADEAVVWVAWSCSGVEWGITGRTAESSGEWESSPVSVCIRSCHSHYKTPTDWFQEQMHRAWRAAASKRCATYCSSSGSGEDQGDGCSTSCHLFFVTCVPVSLLPFVVFVTIITSVHINVSHDNDAGGMAHCFWSC